ncbi:MAG: SseB family protein [Legionellaceae bacterium]|nr:SseB family protein [Legionellaceae bacterium]
MSTLEHAVAYALQHPDDSRAIDKAYLEFIKANFMIPIHAHSAEDAPEVLYLEENGIQYLPAFTNTDTLDVWAKDIAKQIKILRLTGVNLLKGVGEHVAVCLNLGDSASKIFHPEEIARMKSLIIKFWK